MKDDLSSQITRNFRKSLSELALFADLAPRNLDELAHGTCNVIYQRGQSIFRAGDLVSQLYVLISGQVKISLSCRRGNERVLELLEPGQSFGQAISIVITVSIIIIVSKIYWRSLKRRRGFCLQGK